MAIDARLRPVITRLVQPGIQSNTNRMDTDTRDDAAIHNVTCNTHAPIWCSLNPLILVMLVMIIVKLDIYTSYSYTRDGIVVQSSHCC